MLHIDVPIDRPIAAHWPCIHRPLTAHGPGRSHSFHHAPTPSQSIDSPIDFDHTHSTLWTNGWPRFLSSGKNPHYGTAVEHHVALFWEWVAEPLLFGLVGTAVDFHYINASTIPKSLLVIISGWAARCPATFFAVMGAGLTWKERLFVTLTWLPKATVQAVCFSWPCMFIKHRCCVHATTACWLVQHEACCCTVMI